MMISPGDLLSSKADASIYKQIAIRDQGRLWDWLTKPGNHVHDFSGIVIVLSIPGCRFYAGRDDNDDPDKISWDRAIYALTPNQIGWISESQTKRLVGQ